MSSKIGGYSVTDFDAEPQNGRADERPVESIADLKQAETEQAMEKTNENTVPASANECPDEPQTGYGPILINLADIDPEPVSWLWPNRFPLGKLSLLVGNPDAGKSFFSIDMAARITSGRPWPDSDTPIRRGSVIVINAEDDLADTIRVRADAAGISISTLTRAKEDLGIRPYRFDERWCWKLPEK